MDLVDVPDPVTERGAGDDRRRWPCAPGSSTTIFTAPTAAGIRQAVILAVRAGHPRLPAALAGGHRGLRDRPARGHRVQDRDAGRPRRRSRPPTAAPSRIDLRDDWPAALRAAGLRPDAADRVDRRGPADLPAARRAGPAVRPHHRTQSAPGSTVATEYVPGILDFDADQAREMSAPLREHGLDIDMSSLVYAGERSHVMEYLRDNGWQVTGFAARRAVRRRYGLAVPAGRGRRPARRDRLRQRARWPCSSEPPVTQPQRVGTGQRPLRPGRRSPPPTATTSAPTASGSDAAAGCDDGLGRNMSRSDEPG